MSVTWYSAVPPDDPRIPLLGWILVILRGGPLVLVLAVGLLLTGLLRLAERPLAGSSRPATPYVTQAVCWIALRLMGVRHVVTGRPAPGVGAYVANHASWMDIFTLNACDRFYFVSKSEVAGWPGIGWLARATGTVFVNRRGRDAATQTEVLARRLKMGHKLCVFPEGTSTDGLRVLHFKSTAFAAFFASGPDWSVQVQPVSIIYKAPNGVEPRFYGWWGDMEFGPHLCKLLAAPRQGSVEVMFHDPLSTRDLRDRKTMAKAAETAVRQGVSQSFANSIG